LPEPRQRIPDRDDDAPPTRWDTRPIPDPTLLTTQQLRRELLSLREIIEARIEGMNRAIELAGQRTERMPGELLVYVDRLKDLHEEKFRSVQLQFSERDIRTEQTSRDSKVAVDAALQAAKEAVSEQNKSSALAIGKSEASTTKQIDQQSTLIQTTTQGLNDKIGDLKDRLTLLEGKAVGVTAQVTTQNTSNSYLVTAIGVGAAIVFGLAGLAVALFNHIH
jgi:hypothetical protein